MAVKRSHTQGPGPPVGGLWYLCLAAGIREEIKETLVQCG